MFVSLAKHRYHAENHGRILYILENELRGESQLSSPDRYWGFVVVFFFFNCPFAVGIK